MEKGVNWFITKIWPYLESPLLSPLFLLPLQEANTARMVAAARTLEYRGVLRIKDNITGIEVLPAGAFRNVSNDL
jgi:hypothetical protein